MVHLHIAQVDELPEHQQLQHDEGAADGDVAQVQVEDEHALEGGRGVVVVVVVVVAAL